MTPSPSANVSGDIRSNDKLQPSLRGLVKVVNGWETDKRENIFFLKKFIRDEIIVGHCSSVAAWPLFIKSVTVPGYLLICGDNTLRNETSEQ